MSRILVAFLFLAPLTLHAQGSLSTQRDNEQQHLLGMTQVEYRGYKDSLHLFNQRLDLALSETSLDENKKQKAVAKAMEERKAYLIGRLSDKQRRKLYQFYRKNSLASPVMARRQTFENRLKSKGIKVIRDTVKH